jgi:hypothetical protein
LIQNSDLTSLARQNAVSIAGQEGVGEGGFMGGSTDAGDLAHLIPTIQPYAGGVQGLLHSSGFKVIDYDSAVIYPAKVMAMTAIDLLYGDAGEARRVIENFKPAMRIDDYLAFLEEMTR